MCGVVAAAAADTIAEAAEAVDDAAVAAVADEAMLAAVAANGVAGVVAVAAMIAVAAAAYFEACDNSYQNQASDTVGYSVMAFEDNHNIKGNTSNSRP